MIYNKHCPLLFALVLALSACGSNGRLSDTSSSSESSMSSSESSSSSSQSSSSAGVDEACPNGRQIVGYFPTWQGSVQDIQYEYLTQILYSFALPNADGTLQPLSTADENKLTELVAMAHGHGVKVGISIGGWNDGDASAFVALTANDETRALFVSEVIDFILAHNLDGVDMDWEHPSSPTEATNNALLMSELRVALDALEDEKFLSTAVVALGDWAGQYILDSVLEDIDYLNIMAYDEWDGGPLANHSSLQYAADSIAYWKNKGAVRSKMNLGVPFYSRVDEGKYSDKVALDPANACVDEVDGNYHNGIPTIRTKSAYVETDVCGIMIWEISQDTTDETSLLKAIWEVVNGQEQTYICD